MSFTQVFGLGVRALCVALLVLLVGGSGLAFDYEDPGDPGPDPVIGKQVIFGDVTVDVLDAAGSAVDAKAAVEPFATALLILGEAGNGAGSGLSALCAPSFQLW